MGLFSRKPEAETSAEDELRSAAGILGHQFGQVQSGQMPDEFLWDCLRSFLRDKIMDAMVAYTAFVGFERAMKLARQSAKDQADAFRRLGEPGVYRVGDRASDLVEELVQRGIAAGKGPSPVTE